MIDEVEEEGEKGVGNEEGALIHTILPGCSEQVMLRGENFLKKECRREVK